MTHAVERDPLGELRVPAGAYYGVQTAARGRELPDQRSDAPAAARHRDRPHQAGLRPGQRDAPRLEPRGRRRNRRRPPDEILAGKLRDQFVVDVYQAGAGTSHNMNANEVLANRAGELLGEPKGSYRRVHPNDHVNMGQSTNDVFPTATRLALLLVPAAARRPRQRRWPTRSRPRRARSPACSRPDARTCRTPCRSRSVRSSAATPPTCGTPSASSTARGRQPARAESRSDRGRHRAERRRRFHAGMRGRPGARHGPRRSRRRATASASPRAWATCSPTRAPCGGWQSRSTRSPSDLRLLSSGPRAGLAEIQLPAVQPGSSIMPGKVNPSVPEMVNQVCQQVWGCDADDPGRGRRRTARTERDDAGHRVERPPRVEHLRQRHGGAGGRGASAASAPTTARCRELLDRSTALATALSPYIGYAQTADVAKAAVKTGRSIARLVRERQLIPDDQLDAILSPEEMTSPGIPGGGRPARARRLAARTGRASRKKR